MNMARLAVVAVLLAALCAVSAQNFTELDKQMLGVALNLEYLEAELFLHGAVGKGLDQYAPYLTGGGPPPIGAQQAKLDPECQDIFYQMGLQEVGHIRAIKAQIGDQAFPRVQLDISKATFAKLFDSALNETLNPPFDAYASCLNFYLASYWVPYVGLTGYTGSAPYLTGFGAKSLAARLLGVEAGQDAIIRTWLYERKNLTVPPYDFNVAYITDKVSYLRNMLDHGDVDDEGLTVPQYLGSEDLVEGNILSANKDSVSYTRTPEQIFSVVYSTGNASIPGGIYPKGGNGTIAKSFLG